MKKLAREVNITVIEMKGSILAISIDNQMMNATNIAGISEDLWYLVQSNMEDWAFQIQRMLANKLDKYKGNENTYVDENIWEIQELYINKEQTKKKGGRIKEEEVILIKLYEVSELTASSSFTDEKVNNLLKYMKFVKSPTQTRIFQPPPHYQVLWSRGEQNSDFWNEITTVLVKNKHNTEMSRNKYSINMFQEGPPHDLFFITIDNQGHLIIDPNKKMVATYVIGELEILV